MNDCHTEKLYKRGETSLIHGAVFSKLEVRTVRYEGADTILFYEIIVLFLE